MSYIVKQKINDRIYLYEVTNRWDKKLKKTKQTRKYLGPEERIYKKRGDAGNDKVNFIKSDIIKAKKSNFISKSYGNIFLVTKILNDLSIDKIIKSYFGSLYHNIILLISFMLESEPSYLFPYWYDENHVSDISDNKLYSSDISAIYEEIGRDERSRMEFLKEWSQHINPNSGIYYDITSISSYSDNITVLENGYNRDKEYLPQVNMGIIHCSKSNLPISYNLYPGSIVDVSTLKNNIKLFNLFELKDLFLILDRGFCSIANMIDMVKNNMIFIQPLSYSLNKARNLIEKNKENIIKSDNIFKYKEEILYHLKDQMELDNKTKLDCHIIYNEKQAISFKHNLYSNLIDIEQKQLDLNNNDIKLNNIIFSDKISAQKYIENNIISKYQKFFTILEKKNKSNNSKISYQIIRDNKEIENAIFRSGSFILATNKKDIGNIEIIDCYRNRDSVEKDIDSLKNHLDSKRLRSHNKDTANGKLFIKFISLILYNYINKNIKKNKKLKHNSFKEILLELKKLKINSFDKNKQFLTEISKKQKLIFNTMNIKESDIENMVIK